VIGPVVLRCLSILSVLSTLAIGGCSPSPSPATESANPAPPASPSDAKPVQPESVEPATPTDVAGPMIPVQLTASLEHDGVRVRIANPGDETVRVWALGNSWCDSSWGLRVRSGANTWTLRPTNQGYTRNFPRFIEIAAKGEHEIRLEPSGPEWTAGEDLPALESAEIHVAAVLDIVESAQTEEHDVAVGHVESAEVVSKPPHSWLFASE
jgi:hypothetical protein